MTKLTHILYLFEYVMVDLASNERKDTFVSSIEGKDTAWDDDSKVVGMQKYLCFFFLSIFSILVVFLLICLCIFCVFVKHLKN